MLKSGVVNKKIQKTCSNLEDTKKVATNIAKGISSGDVICLYGEIGAGKTYFTKYLCEALGLNQDDIISPTYVFWRKYSLKNLDVNHFDFYRLNSPDELLNIGFEEAVNDKNALSIIEWADRISDRLPERRIDIHIKIMGKRERLFIIERIGYGKN